MKIQKIYDKYKILPNLQLHMLRVAGVVSMICDNYDKQVDKISIISATLLHDVGNMVRIDFDKFPQLNEGLDLNYWKNLQKNFIYKYGLNEYEATNAILKELNLPDDIITIVSIGEVINMPIIENGNSIETKVFIYSDTRVSPFGTTSLLERLSEVKERFIKKKNISGEEYEMNIVNKALAIEKQIFSNCKIKPEDITEEKVQPLLENLRDFDIKTKY